MKRAVISTAIITLACSTTSVCVSVTAQNAFPPIRAESPRPAYATRCDLSVPIRITLTPVNEAGAGGIARFSVNTESGLDPDLVKRMWVEYEIPEQIRQHRESVERREVSRHARQNREELGVVVPERGRHALRARFVVELVDGRTISKTATRWINPGDALPDGMTGRIFDPDGTGIRVYQGTTERN